MAESEKREGAPTQDMGAVDVQVRIPSVDQAWGDAPVIWVDGANGIISKKGSPVVQFSFFQDLMAPSVGSKMPEHPVVRRIAARFVMEEKTFASIAKWMQKYVDDNIKPKVEAKNG